MTLLKRKDILYPELSYQIVGILFEVYNQLGPNHRESYYQKAVAEGLRLANIKFKEQVSAPLNFTDKRVGNYFLDFLIEDKIILEIKVGDRFRKSNIDQLYSYLRATNLSLGILANFTRSGLKFKRIVNIK